MKNLDNKKALLFLFLIGAAVYANILNAPFVLDDHELLLGNQYIRSIPLLLENWDEEARKFITYLTFAVNYRVGGENTFGYHLVNVVLHLLNSFLFYFSILLLFRAPALKNSSLSGQKGLFALSAGCIFLVHPLQTQAVTYIWQRSEVLSAFFYLSAFWMYLRARVEKQSVLFLTALITFYLGFFAKGTVVTLPLMIILAELCFFITDQEKRNKLLLTACGAAGGVLVLWHFKILTAVLKKVNLSFMMPREALGIYDLYVYTQFKVLLKYIQLSFLPLNQNIDYQYPLVKTFLNAPTIASLAVLISILAAALLLFNRNRLMSFGIFWFFIYLIPTSAGVLVTEPLWEHRLYLSLAGYAVFLTSLLFAVFQNARYRTAAVVFIVVCLCGLTVARNNVWRSPIALLSDSVSKSPLNVRAYLNLGTEYLKEGYIHEAVEIFKKAIALNENASEVHYKKAQKHLGLGMKNEAEEYFADAERVKSYSALMYNNLGLAYLMTGESMKAELSFETAIKRNPDFYKPYINLAQIALNRGNSERSLNLLETSLRYRKLSQTYFLLGQVYLYKGDIKSAERSFEQAIKINPRNYAAQKHLAQFRS